jgi:hypothetical protein
MKTNPFKTVILYENVCHDISNDIESAREILIVFSKNSVKIYIV